MWLFVYHATANASNVTVNILQFGLVKIVTKHCMGEWFAIKIETPESFHTAAFLFMNEENWIEIRSVHTNGISLYGLL